MNELRRPVDIAMAEDRLEKRTIRSLWLDEVKEVARQFPESEVPWYLTLSGAEGRDIQLVIDEGLLSLTEVNSIAEKDQGKIVAVEQNNLAIATLQRKFIGLRIKEVPFHSLIRGEELFKWPEGQDEKFCRARVINLDLNTPLKALQADGQVVFPVLAWIDKLSKLHARSPRTDWTLCLTLHGEIVWPEDVNRWTKNFLLENLRREPAFAEDCREFFGDPLFRHTTNDDETDFTQMSREDQQKFIMVMVPKIISRLVHNEGWQVLTERNLCYGGADRAPMVTWIVRFTWNDNATATPDATYRSALCNIFQGVGIIRTDGQITNGF